MKLRLRSFESKQTLKIEVPNPCTLPQLKQILSQNLPNSSSAAAIRLSLNRKDDLQSDGEQSLHSLGIASGDLIFFSLEQPTAGMSSNSVNTIRPPADARASRNSECSTSQISDSVMLESHKGKTLDMSSKMEETVDEMEVDDQGKNLDSHSSDELSAEVVDKSFSVPAFLRKVFVEELGDDDGPNHELVVIAIHAVMLETGFVGFDKNKNMVVNGYQLCNEWPSGLFRVSLFYTLPETESLDAASDKGIKSVLLKFQSLGKFIKIYGTLLNGSEKRSTYTVQLNEDQLVPFLNVVWATCGLSDSISAKDGDFLGTSPEKEVFNFWKTVKDNLSLPLLIDLCEESGLELPPCFMRLPTDLKLKILESVSGEDLAKVSCVCSELRYLGSNDDLWKLKFSEEFGNELQEAQGRWKQAFATSWDLRSTTRRVASRSGGMPYFPAPYWSQPRRRRYPNPNPFLVPQVPRIIGGDYDIGPMFGDDVQNRMLDAVNQPRHSFAPPCNLGVRGGRFV